MSTLSPGERMEIVQRIPMSWEEYLQRPPEERSEWADGEAIMMSPASRGHGVVALNLGFVLKSHLPTLKVGVESGFRMERSLRGPDVVVTAAEDDGPWITSPPVVVAEVLSPSTRSEDLLRKSVEYAEAGAGQYWVVDPDARTVEVLELVDGRWATLLRLDDQQRTGEVAVGEHVVPLDLDEILDT